MAVAVLFASLALVQGRLIRDESYGSEAAQAAPRVAVVGCGVAGLLTTLELVHRGAEVTLFEREKDCRDSTSGRVAAEMMFYSYRRGYFQTGTKVDSAYTAATNLQMTANLTNGRLWSFGSTARAAQARGKLRLHLASAYEPGDLTFVRRGPVLLVETVSDAFRAKCTSAATWSEAAWSHLALWAQPAAPVLDPTCSGLAPGDLLEPPPALLGPQGKPSTPARLHGWDPAGLDRALAELGVTELAFRRQAELRQSSAYQEAFFGAAKERLRSFFLENFPELCAAVVTPLCCEVARARSWVEANPAEAGYRCSEEPRMGVAHVFLRNSVFANMANVTAERDAEQHGFARWDATEVRARLPSFAAPDSARAAAVANSGFVRTERLAEVVLALLEQKGYAFRSELGREVVGVESRADEVEVSTQRAGGTWQTREGVREFRPPSSLGARHARRERFDRVVLATGAALGPLQALDAALPAQLVPAFGCIVTGGPKLEAKERFMGVVFEEMHLYMRSTLSGDRAIGGGMWLGSAGAGMHDSEVRRLPWSSGWLTGCDQYMRQTKFSEETLDSPTATKYGGARPMSYLGNFPILKTYLSGKVVLNTGGGPNGFVISWKAGELAAELALGEREKGHPDWPEAHEVA